ncbi:MAG: DM13 domain-containing protein [Chloroflexi bacterium]|nr:DM13 domain-containing protein [Chloroflexota bacterium]
MQIIRWATSTRERKIIASLAIALVIAIAIPAVWLASPLFDNKTVDEEFPLTVSAEIPANVTREEAEVMMETASKLDMPAEESMTLAMEGSASSVIAMGELMDEDFFHKGSGKATIYRLGDGSSVLRFEGLNVTNGPDLHVLLLEDPTVRDKDLGYIDLGGLKGNRGNQNYELPDGTDASTYHGVMIYCQPFRVIFSTAQLTAADSGA